jgi:hypothetical protein
MGNAFDMLILLALGASVVLWMEFSVWRERAVRAARSLCQRYQVQLLDETVGLRRLRLRRVTGRLRIERCYDFEVSLDGSDRRPGQLWMIGQVVSHSTLPSPQVPVMAATDDTPIAPRDNVVLLSSRRPGTLTRLQ